MGTKSISVRLKLFSVAKELAGFDEKLVELPPDSPSEAIIRFLVNQNPLFERWKPSLRIAVNLRYVDNGHKLRDGDEVAVIPPVSGG